MTTVSGKSQAINNIVVVGAGTIGWTVSMALARGLQGQKVTITLIDEGNTQVENIDSSIISASHHLFDFHKSMGVNEQHLLSQGHGKLTCAKQYVNWFPDRPNFFIGNNTFQPTFNNISAHHLILSRGIENFSDYSFAAQVAIQGKSLESLPNNLYGYFNTGMILKNEGYSSFMQGAALHLGVDVIYAKFKHAELSKSSGLVKTVTLDDGVKLPVDLLIDNSGTCSKVMQGILGVKYKDDKIIPFKRLLTANKSVKNSKVNSHYSTVAANELGILEQFTLNGTQYYSQLCVGQLKDKDDSVIKEQFISVLGADKSSITNFTQRNIRFGKSERFFYKNCVVVGEAAGYVSSPSVTNLVLAQRAISRLLDLFPTKKFFSSTADEYNRLTENDYNEASDFLSLHLYLASTSKDDKKYKWSKKIISLSSTLQQKITLFKCYGRYEDELNAMIISPCWIDILSQCCRIKPNYEPLLQTFDDKEVDSFLAELQQNIYEKVNKLN